MSTSEDQKIETDHISIGGAGLHIGELAEFEPVPTATQYLLRAVAMLGIGFLVHAWLLGPHLDITSAWSWGYVIAWPVVLVVTFIGWLLYPVIGAVLVFLGWLGFNALRDRRRAKRDRRRREEIEAVEGITDLVNNIGKRVQAKVELARKCREQAEREAAEQNLDEGERQAWANRRGAELFRAGLVDIDTPPAAHH